MQMSEADLQHMVKSSTVATLEVECDLFSVYGNHYGTVTVRNGCISIELDHIPERHMNDTPDDQYQALMKIIDRSVKACWDAMPEAFEKKN